MENNFNIDRNEISNKLYDILNKKQTVVLNLLDNELDKNEIKKFIDFVVNYLEIDVENDNLEINLHYDRPEEMGNSFAYYDIVNKIILVVTKGRHILDIFRSLAHEMVHHKQNQDGKISEDQLGEENDGVNIENEANAIAGVIMREYGRRNNELFG